MIRWVERIGIVLASLAIAIGVIALLSGGLAGGRDDPGLSQHASGTTPGTAFRDQGDTQLASGAARPHYDSDPPTSGAHRTAAITADNERVDDDQLLSALALGDVVLLYSTPQPPKGLRAIADAVAPPFTAALGRTGQAVILARRPGLTKVTAVAWTRMLRSDDGTALRDFAGYWLGRGAAGARVGSIVGSG